MNDIEKKAIQVGDDKWLLYKRLMEARGVFGDEELFKNATFDFPNKRLISQCGKFVLQWKLRDFPTQPEGYRNQQTSRGTVVFLTTN